MSCQTTYPLKFQENSPIPIYPSKCRHRHEGKRCNTPLLKSRVISSKGGFATVYTPIKTFVYFSPVEWLGRLLSRPGLEAEMDHSWSDAQNFRKSSPGLMRDIFDGDLLRNFKGPDGKHFSVGGGEGRYTFSLSVDFFNPLENKQAGKKISVGIITAVCLNLPPHLRYRSENIFLVGVIPGPHEPPLTAINNFLRPVVNDFLTMWSPGAYYSQNDGHRNGKLVRCAIVCVVCNLPAALKTTSFISFSHNHFCAVCECTLKRMATMTSIQNPGHVTPIKAAAIQPSYTKELESSTVKRLLIKREFAGLNFFASPISIPHNSLLLIPCTISSLVSFMNILLVFSVFLYQLTRMKILLSYDCPFLTQKHGCNSPTMSKSHGGGLCGG